MEKTLISLNKLAHNLDNYVLVEKGVMYKIKLVKLSDTEVQALLSNPDYKAKLDKYYLL